jgi:hypothetical protein
MISNLTMLAGVCKACSSREAGSGGKLAQFQQQFAKDLDPTLPSSPQTLGEMTERLKVPTCAATLCNLTQSCMPYVAGILLVLICHGPLAYELQGWRMLLETAIDHKLPRVFKMEQEAPLVSLFTLVRIENTSLALSLAHCTGSPC